MEKYNMIYREDVQNVASSLKKNLTDKQILCVLENYESAQKANPSATWDLVVEQLIYEIEITDKFLNIKSIK